MKNRRKISSGIWEKALDRASLGVWDWNIESGRCDYSETWYRMLGYERKDLPEDNDLWLQLVHPDDRERAIASGEVHIAGATEGIETELRLRHRDGHWLWVLDRGGIIERDSDGNPVRLVGVQTDISPQKEVERKLERANERLRMALDVSGAGVWHFDEETNKVYWDARMREIFGLPPGPAEVPRGLWHQCLHPQDKCEAELLTQKAMEKGGLKRLSYRIVRPDGEVRHVIALVRYVNDKMSPARMVGVVHDVTENIRAKEALDHEREKLHATLEAIGDAVVSTDSDGLITYANGAAKLMLHIPADDTLIGKSLDQIVDGLSQSGAPNAFPPTDQNQRLVKFLHAGKEEKIFRWTTCNPQSSAGAALDTVHTFHDLTAEHRNQVKLNHAARHDSLTGLLNRPGFEAELAKAVSGAGRHGWALLYIDLDYFKAINDFGGHSEGDRALKNVSRRIRDCLAEDAVIARLGGDEFAALFRADELAAAIDRADAMIESIKATNLSARQSEWHLGASIGITMITEVSTVADALARADDACYAAKKSGRNKYMVFDGNSVLHRSGLTAVRIVADLADAMEDGRLKVYGQEIRNVRDPWNSIGKVEILARLINRGNEMMFPSEFIPAAERFGMASVLDRWMFKSAVTRFAKYLSGDRGYTMGFNLSAQTLSDKNLWDFVDQTIDENGIQPSNIVFEITESTAITNFDAAERFVVCARGRNCRVSLDDFGAGLSSFEYLRRFPIDSLKINGSFIQNIARDRYDLAIVRSIARIAEELEIPVIAEKINDRKAIGILADMGITYGQGYILHTPQPLEEILSAERLRSAVPRLRKSG